jgi:hypothetical protein
VDKAEVILVHTVILIKVIAITGNRTQDICLEGRYFTTKL